MDSYSYHWQSHALIITTPNQSRYISGDLAYTLFDELEATQPGMFLQLKLAHAWEKATPIRRPNNAYR